MITAITTAIRGTTRRRWVQVAVVAMAALAVVVPAVPHTTASDPIPSMGAGGTSIGGNTDPVPSMGGAGCISGTPGGCSREFTLAQLKAECAGRPACVLSIDASGWSINWAAVVGSPADGGGTAGTTTMTLTTMTFTPAQLKAECAGRPACVLSIDASAWSINWAAAAPTADGGGTVGGGGLTGSGGSLARP